MPAVPRPLAPADTHTPVAAAKVARPPPGDFGAVVCNPPYGMRLGDNQVLPPPPLPSLVLGGHAASLTPY